MLARHRVRPVLIGLICPLILLAAQVSSADDRKINVLLIGEVYPQECPLPLLFDNDPIYDYISIRTREGPAGQLTEEMKRRYVKL